MSLYWFIFHNLSHIFNQKILNYLAHIYLSGNNPNIKIGGFIADSIKGSAYKEYPQEIQAGILLHRQIDWFTDNDNIFKTSKLRLQDQYRHYKGVIIDIFYDHFLAANWSKFSNQPLIEFSQDFYGLLIDNKSILPPKIKQMMPYMINGDWLTSYATLDGIESVLNGMNRRTKGISKMDLAIKDLKKNYQDFDGDFNEFFKKLCTFSNQKLNEINANLQG